MSTKSQSAPIVPPALLAAQTPKDNHMHKHPEPPPLVTIQRHGETFLKSPAVHRAGASKSPRRYPLPDATLEQLAAVPDELREHYRAAVLTDHDHARLAGDVFEADVVEDLPAFDDLDALYAFQRQATGRDVDFGEKVHRLRLAAARVAHRNARGAVLSALVGCPVCSAPVPPTSIRSVSITEFGAATAGAGAPSLVACGVCLAALPALRAEQALDERGPNGSRRDLLAAALGLDGPVTP